MTTAFLVVAAGVTATLSGVLGMGGGMTLLGIMTALLPAPVVVPIHGAVQLASNFTRTLVFIREVKWRVFAVYAGPMTLGVYGASQVWSGDKLSMFKPAIGVFLVLWLISRRHKPTLRNVPLWVFFPLGLVVGFLNIFVGATGPFIAPFFLRDDFTKEQVIATKAVCQAWAHLLKIPAFLSLGFDYGPWLKTLGVLVLAVVAGTMFGKWLLSRISRAGFERLFLGLLAAIAAYLILAPLWDLVVG
jgi:uncharacterized membrane protein YfcA